MVKCPKDLPVLTDGKGETITITMNEWAKQYHRCAIPHNGLVDAINEVSK